MPCAPAAHLWRSLVLGLLPKRGSAISLLLQAVFTMLLKKIYKRQK